MHENYLTHEHDYIHWSDAELGRRAMDIIHLLATMDYSSTRKAQQVFSLRKIDFEQDQRYVETHPEAVKLSKFVIEQLELTPTEEGDESGKKETSGH